MHHFMYSVQGNAKITSIEVSSAMVSINVKAVLLCLVITESKVH